MDTDHGHHHTLDPSGDGTVVLDIGGDVGAIVLHTPHELAGMEIDIFRRGDDRPAMHTAVDQASTCFFAACASAHAPRMGPATITSAYETASAAVHANVAQGALPATTETKYALKTAVSTTVV